MHVYMCVGASTVSPSLSLSVCVCVGVQILEELPDSGFSKEVLGTPVCH